MRTEFMFFIFCSISSAYDFMKEPGRSIKCTTSSGSSRGTQGPLRALDFATTEAESSTVRDRNRLRNQVEYLPSNTRSALRNGWSENQNQLLALHRDSKELTARNSEINEELSRLEVRMRRYPETRAQIFWNAFNILKESNEFLVIFKQIKLFNLGHVNLANSNSNLMRLIIPRAQGSSGWQESPDFSRLPADIIQLITQESWRKVGNSIIEKLKTTGFHLTFDTDVLFERLNFKSWWKCALKEIDFLFKYELADHSIVRSFFENIDTVRKITSYINLRYKDDFGESILARTSFLTEHWYWSLLHESFQAMSKKQAVIFNGHVLLEVRYKNVLEECRMAYSYMPSQECEIFFESFNSKEYMKKLLALDESDQSASHEEAVDIDSQNMINRDAEALISLIANSYHQFNIVPMPAKKTIVNYICELLEFIDKYISPGIIERKASNELHYQEFTAKFITLIITYSKINEIYTSANDYYKYIQKQSPSDWSKSEFYKSKFNDYLTQTLDQIHGHQVESIRLKQKLRYQNNASLVIEAVDKVQKRFQDLVNHLKQKIATFS